MLNTCKTTSYTTKVVLFRRKAVFLFFVAEDSAGSRDTFKRSKRSFDLPSPPLRFYTFVSRQQRPAV